VPAYVLHQQAYRDSGRIVELLTREHGRLSVFAHGVRRAKSGLAAALQPFQRLLVGWSGRGEAPTLTGAELDPAAERLPAAQFMSGCYMNELVLKLTTRHDAHPELFDLYEQSLAGLATDAQATRALRIFEKRLLDIVGFGLALGVTAQGQKPLDPSAHYRFRPQVGAIEATAGAGGRLYSGAALLALAQGTISDAEQLSAVKPLLREALEACLEGRSLSTREIARAVRRKQSGG
jgi:DNA repair protein RecO (recombination protein O)